MCCIPFLNVRMHCTVAKLSGLCAALSMIAVNFTTVVNTFALYFLVLWRSWGLMLEHHYDLNNEL